MEATELLKTLETAAGNLRKFLESAENKSGEKAAEDYVKEHELEYIEDSVKRAFKAGFIFCLRYVWLCKCVKVESEDLDGTPAN